MDLGIDPKHYNSYLSEFMYRYNYCAVGINWWLTQRISTECKANGRLTAFGSGGDMNKVQWIEYK